MTHLFVHWFPAALILLALTVLLTPPQRGTYKRTRLVVEPPSNKSRRENRDLATSLAKHAAGGGSTTSPAANGTLGGSPSAPTPSVPKHRVLL